MSKPRIISLSGFMGVGKSTVGRKLAYILDNELIDLDAYIEKQQGRSISNIFDTEGEAAFRELETNYLTEILDRNTPLVLSLGGGTICYTQSAKLIKENCHRVYLRATIDTLVSQLSESAVNRPLLKDQDIRTVISALLVKRSPVYEAESDFVIDIDGKSVIEIAEEIESLFY